MAYIQKYPLLEPLPKITRHDQLPVGAVELARCEDAVSDSDPKLFMLVKRGQHLSVVCSLVWNSNRGPRYLCSAYDYPLRVLSWFPKALEEFRKPSAQGGLHPGAMSGADENVDGEMLCVESTTDGYYLANSSRQNPVTGGSSYVPTRCPLTYTLLYDLGFLDTWKQLGEKYERGEF